MIKRRRTPTLIYCTLIDLELGMKASFNIKTKELLSQQHLIEI